MPGYETEGGVCTNVGYKYFGKSEEMVLYGPGRETFTEAAHAWNNEARKQEGK
jgi:hypothetical protein